MGKYFGTDGVRGIANTELDSDKAYRMGRACLLYTSYRGVLRCGRHRYGPCHRCMPQAWA